MSKEVVDFRLFYMGLLYFIFILGDEKHLTIYRLGQLGGFVRTADYRPLSSGTKILTAPTNAGVSLFQCDLTQIPFQKCA